MNIHLPDDDNRMEWHAPVITEAPIDEATENRFSRGIDNYEADNPVNYGS